MKIIVQKTRQAVMQAVEEWVELLASSKYVEASEFLYQESDRLWPPQMLEEIVTSHRVVENQTEISVVTSARGASGGALPRHDFKSWSSIPGYVGEVWYDMPVLGQWSDLTASFLLKEHGRDFLLVLEDFRVM